MQCRHKEVRCINKHICIGRKHILQQLSFLELSEHAVFQDSQFVTPASDKPTAELSASTSPLLLAIVEVN